MSEVLSKRDLNLEGTPRTMFITMLARARETQRSNALFQDKKAVEMQRQLDGIFETQKGDWKSETGVIIRTTILDTYIGDFIRQNPNAVCINIGCGLDTRFYRLNNGKIKWYDIDLPEVIALRKKLIGEHEQVTMVGCSMLDAEWTNQIDDEGRPVLIIMEGLLMYFEEKDVTKALDIIHKRFAKATLILELLSAKVVGNTSMTKSIQKTGASFKWGVNSGKDVEKVNNHIKFVKEMNLVDRMYLKSSIYKVLAKISFIRNMSNRIAIFIFQ